MSKNEKKKDSKQDKIKKLIQQRHPNAILIENASIGSKLDVNEYGAFLEDCVVVYTLNQSETGLVRIGRLPWFEETKGLVDHFAFKSIFDLDNTTFVVGNHGKVIEKFLKANKQMSLEVKERKWHEKILGFRSGAMWKKVIASLAYLFLFLTVVAAFLPEDSGPVIFAASLLTLGVGLAAMGISIYKKRSLKISSIISLAAIILFFFSFTFPTDSERAAVDEPDEIETEIEAESTADKEPEAEEEKQIDDNKPSSTEEKPDDEEKEKSEDDLTAATVVNIVDGDTIDIKLNGKKERVRLLLVDTPETKHPDLPTQKFGPEASAFTTSTLSGKEVKVEYDGPKYDKYDRLLAYIWVDGENFNQTLLEEGLARYAYEYDPPYEHAEEMKEAQAEAKAAERGVWSIDGYVTDEGFKVEEKKEVAKSPEPSDSEPSTPEESSEPDLKYNPFGPDRDCGDFDTHAQAQAFYIAAGGPGSDPHRLDGHDSDGLACESLP
ncbi:thermonuclease family protein [Halobacillus litoralis]|uniref:thermonuclease family protein n=1 Tax=Halobacillus litoralis TaxID=45668 RepID=UPI001CFCFF4E|nr:thermonuclease family protein [Halobacillus litoralis]